MLKHTFRARENLDGRVVIHPQGSAPDGYVLGEALEGEELFDGVVVEGSGEAGYMLTVESLRGYSEYLDESVEEVEDEAPAASGEAAQTDQVEQRKAEVAESGAEDQVDANALGDLSDAGKPSATEAQENVPDPSAKRASNAKSKGDNA